MKYLANAIEWKLKKLDEWENRVSIRTEDGILSEWNVTGMSQPDEETLQSWCDEYELKGLPEFSFSVDLMTSRLGEEFTGASAVALAPYLGAIQSYGKAKNFKGMKEFINGLVALGKATPDEGDTMKDVALEQGIDLDTY